MQLPLSASALVILGVAAVLIGASILAVLAMRRRKPSKRPTRVPSDMRRQQQPAAAPDHHAATLPVDDPARPAEPVSVPAQQPPEPVPPPVPEPVVSMPAQPAPAPVPPPAPERVPEPVAPVAAAAMPRPVEVSSRVDPPERVEQVHADPTPSGELPAVPALPHQAGSGRTVAAAVAQAFAVRAAASRAGVQRPVDEGPPPGPAPAPAPAEVVDDVDPAATTDPDGLGVAALADPEPAGEPLAHEPEAAVADTGWAAAPEFGSNGSHGPEGNGAAPESWQPPEPDREPPVEAVAPLAGGWTEPAPAPAPYEPEPAVVPAPRPDDDPARQADVASDARDRLLAVLLDDPERAVGATVELEGCLRELDRLTDAVRTGRTALRDVLHRLAATGLRPDQLARLARLPQAEVQALLEPAEQQASS
jgi:hypothetical protein